MGNVNEPQRSAAQESLIQHDQSNMKGTNIGAIRTKM